MRKAPLLLALAAGLGTTAAQAQTHRAHLGPRLSYNFDAEALAVGVQLGVPMARRLEFYPSFDVYFPDRGSLWGLNADFKYRVAQSRSADWLYLGSGLNLAHRRVGSADNTDAGLNLFAGAEPLRGRVHPFGEARLTLGDGSSFQIAGGLNITLGRH
ncbi:MAG: hypothetical protein AB7L66_07625 [Gemmatimonadales bacterium]